MIISASRRTDIPAFYSEWLMNRIRAGYCQVPNPLNVKQVSWVSLDPADVEAIVFWSKNPAPLIPYLDELDQRGFHYYFQFTLNNYPRAIEPNVPSLESRLDTFKKLSERVGALRVVWRYDPIIISNMTDYIFHRERFSWIADELRGATQRVMVSIVDFYKKTENRLSRLEKEENFLFERDVQYSLKVSDLLKDLHQISMQNNIEIFTCAEETNFSSVGVRPGKCIDDGILMQLQPKMIKYKKDPAQRNSCFCSISKDIGSNNTCMHGCQYCYSTTSLEVAQRRHSEHDPDSPVLWGTSGIVDEKADKSRPQLKLM